MDVYWGSYLGYEGPWARGVQRFSLSATPSEEERLIAVITATEGGTYDAVNMYDVCLWTVGLIQWCNRAPQRSVDSLLGAVAAKPLGDKALEPLRSLAAKRGYSLGATSIGGRPSFAFHKDGAPVTTVAQQRALYFLNASGEKGSWDAPSKAWARDWLCASAAVWESPVARTAQLEYTAARLRSFAVGAGLVLLKAAPATGIGRAWTAMYLSFAANNPAKAAAAVEYAQRTCAGQLSPWTQPWLAHMAYALTTHPGIAIYPIRYNAIRPVIERLYGVDLPDLAKELTAWSVQNFGGKWGHVTEVQQALQMLGYDIGPEGVDGRWSSRLQDALLQFEVDRGTPRDHADGLPDAEAMRLVAKALEDAAVKALS